MNLHFLGGNASGTWFPSPQVQIGQSGGQLSFVVPNVAVKETDVSIQHCI